MLNSLSSVADTQAEVNQVVWIVGEDPATPEDEELWWWYSLDDGEEPAIEDDYTWISRGC